MGKGSADGYIDRYRDFPKGTDEIISERAEMSR
jgi:hypothetical protein